MKVLFALVALAGALLQAPPPPVQKHPPVQIGTTATTGPHQAVLNWSNPSCTTNAQCSIQVYRAQCTSISTCPTYTAGGSAWKALDMSANLAPTVSTNGSTWIYTDKDTALQDSTVYAWCATNSYVGASTSSGASANYAGTTNNGTPPAPTLASSGNSVN